MMGSIKVMVQMGGTVARVTLNRPDRGNAFDREMLREMGDVVRGVGDSEKVRLLVLEGAGGAFCSGADFQAAVGGTDSASNYLGALSKALHSVLGYLAACPAVVMTVVDGPAMGGGLGLALAGDLRVGTPGARFAVGYGRAGLSVDGGLSWRLPRLVGMAQAQRMLFEDPVVGAEEARAIGIIHRVVPATELPKMLEEVAQRVKLQARSVVARNRDLLLNNQVKTLQAALEAEMILLKTSSATEDGAEGVRAAAEKRPPKFEA
jgi:2-(1,2-epoxy-1,2-dihydrophenyl)acetyl-CoA isomerase